MTKSVLTTHMAIYRTKELLPMLCHESQTSFTRSTTSDGTVAGKSPSKCDFDC
jgi:hypothetical protein